MGNEKVKVSRGGMSLLGVLQVVFIVLKLVGVIPWSWWLVLIPLWIELGVLAVCLVVIMILALSE